MSTIKKFNLNPVRVAKKLVNLFKNKNNPTLNESSAISLSKTASGNLVHARPSGVESREHKQLSKMLNVKSKKYLRFAKIGAVNTARFVERDNSARVS